MARKIFGLEELRYKNFSILKEYKKVKYLRLKIDKNLNLKLTVPFTCLDDDVKLFLDKHYKWLCEKYELLSKAKEQDTSRVFFLGKAYKLCFDENISKSKVHKGMILSKNQQEYELFLRKSAEKIFGFYIKKWQDKFPRQIKKVKIKKMKTRWGSCNHSKAYINLNLNLLSKSLKAIEYVILHELNHLKFPHHKREFYENLQKLMPDFRQRELEFKLR